MRRLQHLSHTVVLSGQPLYAFRCLLDVDAKFLGAFRFLLVLVDLPLKGVDAFLSLMCL